MTTFIVKVYSPASVMLASKLTTLKSTIPDSLTKTKSVPLARTKIAVKLILTILSTTNKILTMHPWSNKYTSGARPNMSVRKSQKIGTAGSVKLNCTVIQRNKLNCSIAGILTNLTSIHNPYQPERGLSWRSSRRMSGSSAWSNRRGDLRTKRRTFQKTTGKQ